MTVLGSFRILLIPQLFFPFVNDANDILQILLTNDAQEFFGVICLAP